MSALLDTVTEVVKASDQPVSLNVSSTGYMRVSAFGPSLADRRVAIATVTEALVEAGVQVDTTTSWTIGILPERRAS